MKIKIELDFIKRIVELAFKFPLHELYIDHNDNLVFHTDHVGGYTEYFDIVKGDGS